MAATLAAAALAAGCGSDDGTVGGEQEPADAQRALAEVGKTRDGLDRALRTLRAGDRKAAEEQVGDAYLEHFEHVEGALEDVAPELNEEIEEALSHELRDEIKSGAKAAEIEALADEIRANLDDAEQRLR